MHKYQHCDLSRPVFTRCRGIFSLATSTRGFLCLSARDPNVSSKLASIHSKLGRPGQHRIRPQDSGPRRPSALLWSPACRVRDVRQRERKRARAKAARETREREREGEGCRESPCSSPRRTQRGRPGPGSPESPEAAERCLAQVFNIYADRPDEEIKPDSWCFGRSSV